MIYWLRIFLTFLNVLFFGTEKAEFEDEFVTNHTVLPYDLDLLGHMNNASYNSAAEFARWDWFLRTKMFQKLRQTKIGFVVLGQSFHYRRELRLFQRYQIHTKLVGYDKKFFYVEHTFTRGKIFISRNFLRCAFTKKGKLFATDQALKELLSLSDEVIQKNIELEKSERVTSFIEHDEHMKEAKML
jgi:acyl-CoA thioesterase FadM